VLLCVIADRALETSIMKVAGCPSIALVAEDYASCGR
jgi:hypothetical protein